jgi:hypothetical protein
LAWASSYYLPAILADPIAAGLGVSKAMFFGFFSASLLLQAALGPMIGRAIDRHGGRGVLVLSNLVLAGGLGWLALTHGVIGLAGAWILLGIGMALGLYDSAFATLTALYGVEARAPITGITLIAGFASTARLAGVGSAQPAFRVARRLPWLGGGQSPDLPADEPAPDPATGRAGAECGNR